MLNRTSTLLIQVVSMLVLAFSPAGFAQQSPDLCSGLPSHNRDIAIGRYAKPPHMKYYRDPAFGTLAMRITDGAKGTVYKPTYSTMQAWNADESLILLYQTGGKRSGHVLLDGTNYKLVKTIDIVPADLEEVFWSYKDPDVLFYVSKASWNSGKFIRYNVSTGKQTAIKDFGRECKTGIATVGNDVQMHAHNDDLFGFRCGTKKGPIMFSYRISTDEMNRVEIGDDTSWGQWTALLPTSSGQLFYKDGKVIEYSLDKVRVKLDQAEISEHSSLGKTWNGQDALFQTIFDPSPKGCDGGKSDGVGHLAEFNLETGKCRSIIGPDFGWPYTASGTHVSAVAYKRPGWVAMSSIGYGKFDHFKNGVPAPALTSEIYLVNTDPSNKQICRLAQHRSFAKDSTTKDYHPYFGEPHATISPSGTRILFGSDWYDSGSVDTYVLELPSYQKPE